MNPAYEMLIEKILEYYLTGNKVTTIFLQRNLFELIAPNQVRMDIDAQTDRLVSIELIEGTNSYVVFDPTLSRERQQINWDLDKYQKIFK